MYSSRVAYQQTTQTHTHTHLTVPSSGLIQNTTPRGSHEQLSSIPAPPRAHLEVKEHAVAAVDYG